MISMFTFSSNKHARFLFTIQPAILNALSLADDVAGTPKYFLAILARAGYIYLSLFLFHLSVTAKTPMNG